MNVIENGPGIPQPWTCIHGNTYPTYSLSTCSACRLHEVEKADIGGYSRGFAAGLNAAREAVAALPCAAGRGQDRKPRHVDDFKDSALAAIDALKEKP